ncbi:MarR family transcriptional regulator [Saxibacter everestensis]|uniref:MarR family transcriptional regulator n=1 Tax=Saxibacter everestensis TaxID=2909229 RepID=A0ABY8QZE8_9MICO|nr:MarR family transcriptional regulator [Brevibacteriaceae bacterium ZFBP1038]
MNIPDVHPGAASAASAGRLSGVAVADAPAHRAASEDVRTRQRVLAAVLAHGPITASKLAAELGLTPAAIRRHLDALQDDGHIDVRSLKGTTAKRGRPARQYVVTDSGHSYLGNSYNDLASAALKFVREMGGPNAVAEFAGQRSDEMERKYLPLVESAGSDIASRSRALAAALSADGYAASASPVASGTPMEAMQLCQGHCPVQQIAAEFPEFCEAERQTFARLLGVDVRRLSTLAGGAHVCTTHIPTSIANRPLGEVENNRPVHQHNNEGV